MYLWKDSDLKSHLSSCLSRLRFDSPPEKKSAYLIIFTPGSLYLLDLFLSPSRHLLLYSIAGPLSFFASRALSPQ